MPFTGTITLTYDHTKVGGSDLTNFPVPFFAASPHLKTIGNGGFVNNVNGFDIVVTSDFSGLTTMDFELKNYNAVTGQIEIWVRIPTLSHTVDTKIYIQYGNVTITTDQSNKHAVWDTNYQLVSHFGDVSTLDLTDSTSHSNTGTNHGSTPIAGRVIGGADFISGSSQYIDFGNNSSVMLSCLNLTLEAWVKLPSVQNGVGVSGNFSSHGALFVILNVGGHNFVQFRTANTFQSLTFDLQADTLISLNSWHYLVGTTDGTTKKLYIDSILQSTTDTNTSHFNGTPNTGTFIAGGTNNVGGFITGDIDEIRLSNIARSADWITATYGLITSPPSLVDTLGGNFVANNPI